MNISKLEDFIENRMRMSHVYQPLLIRSLLDAGGKATIRNIAIDFAKEDEALIQYYELRIKRMPLNVLKKRGFVKYENGLVSLSVENLTFDQRAKLRALCEKRISQFLSKRGIATWSRGAINIEPVGESLRYEILKRDQICQLCGATKSDRMLEVDHIVPRSKGGTNDPSNLQVLCSRCNRAKSNRDSTDFR
tara:strand:- start:145 stop:720 length:576 start_codon:yes stop_codon:yes gene_type:complete